MAALARHVADRLIDPSDGTPERAWLSWLGKQNLPVIAPEQWIRPEQRVVVVAPHPDDEVLAVGGLLSQLARLGRTLCLIAVTDGTASHRHSSFWPPHRLAAERPRETEAALAALGAASVQMVRLGFDDGGLAQAIESLSARIVEKMQPGDLLFTTWRLDGHPDHDATGAACSKAAQRTGATLIEVPVWAWHWATPGDGRVPWSRAHRIELDAQTVQRKQAALQAFASQLAPDPSTGEPAVLRPSIVQRAARPFEVFFL